MTSLPNVSSLPHRIDRTIVIRAAREIVFKFLTDTNRWAAWWGSGSSIDARPGGSLHIRYPDGTEAAGQVVEVEPPDRMVFTYGYVSGKPIPPGSSRVTITLAPDRAGTRLELTHEFADAAVRDLHVQGWRYQLSLFSNVVADEVYGNSAAAVADSWFDAWAEPDLDVREKGLARIASRDVRYRDRFSNVDGLADLIPHISGAQRFMPGIRMQRAGAVRHCQGMALVDWVARGTDGQERAHGTNVFVFSADGRLELVTGFYAAPSAA